MENEEMLVLYKWNEFYNPSYDALKALALKEGHAIIETIQKLTVLGNDQLVVANFYVIR